MTAKTLGTGGVAVCFFGDGAANQGTFHEGLNLAAIWKLPVVFVCENNGYAESTPVALPLLAPATSPTAPAPTRCPAWSSTASMSSPSMRPPREAIARARRGEGPTLLEAKTYRYYGHFQGDQVTYRTAEELETYKQRDPITTVRTALIEQGHGHGGRAGRDRRARGQASSTTPGTPRKAAPFPEPEEALTDVYVSY